MLPFLNNGVTFAFFHISGKIPVSIDFLNTKYKGYDIDGQHSFKTWGWTKSQPTDFDLSSAFNLVWTSSCVNLTESNKCIDIFPDSVLPVSLSST